MQAETFYHVYNHANGNENLFRSDENYHYFLRQWTKYISPVACTYTYCLMPNHFHFLIRIKTEEEVLAFLKMRKPTLQGFETLGGFTFDKAISLQFSHLFNSYTQAYNKVYERRGSLFIPNFKRKEINSDAYLSAIISYIHRNPVHHGFCKQIEDWPHSSYHTLLSEKPTQIHREEVIEWFGSRKDLVNFHRHMPQIADKSLLIDFEC
ncbi:MAG: hypothetical protein RIC30_17725 [Marinoscillum sp.]|uniref:transposase n=1 Tax=Marinoscillum sp. TaxID=2024838 RepID=UPI0032FB5741